MPIYEYRCKVCRKKTTALVLSLEHPRRVQAPKRVGVALRRGEIEAQARRDGQVDHDLDGLPQVQNHGIGRVAGRLQIGRPGRQPRGDSGQMALDRHRTLGEQLPVEFPHQPSLMTSGFVEVRRHMNVVEDWRGVVGAEGCSIFCPSQIAIVVSMAS